MRRILTEPMVNQRKHPAGPSVNALKWMRSHRHDLTLFLGNIFTKEELRRAKRRLPNSHEWMDVWFLLSNATVATPWKGCQCPETKQTVYDLTSPPSSPTAVSRKALRKPKQKG